MTAAFPSLDIERRRAASQHGIDIEDSFRQFLTAFLPDKTPDEIEDIIDRAAEEGRILPLPPDYCQPRHRALSPTEAEILALVGAGLSNKQIAVLRGCAAVTVKQHLGSASRKLEAANRTHAVVLALSQGYIQIRAA